MKFSLKRPIKIIMIGAGGTGGYVAPHIYRLLHSLDRPVQFIIADGDIIEHTNLIRQNFVESDLGENKAKILAERYASAFGMEIEYIPDFIEDDSTLMNLVIPKLSNNFMPIQDRIYELVILVGAVDNNKSRQMCHRVFKKANELIYIDSGNGEYTGQVVCGIRRANKTYYKPVGDLYPDVLEEIDKFPSELSCAEAAVSDPQSIVANITAANAIVSYIYNIIVLGQVQVRNVTFSTKTINTKPNITQKNRKRKAA